MLDNISCVLRHRCRVSLLSEVVGVVTLNCLWPHDPFGTCFCSSPDFVP